MKRLILLFVLVFILLFFNSTELKGGDEELFHKYGILAGDSFRDLYFYFGVNADVHLSEGFMISPEINLITRPVCKVIYLEPALILNIKAKTFFFGAGPMKLFLIAGDKIIPSFWGLKLNFGFRANDMIFRFIQFSPFNDLFKDNYFGIQVGFEF
ncbi:MAG: hypothetical protein ABFR75_00290 [Acidobacteriota bacterium]